MTRISPTCPRSVDLLPAPFAWIDIPAGQVMLPPPIFTYGGYFRQTTTFDVPRFSIAKYPLTNAQFRLFVEADGYSQRKWWTDTGWEAKGRGWTWDGRSMVATNQPWTGPRYWTDSAFNGAEQPVTGVSWHEAIAYCLWLRETTGEPITLPTVQQWQRAAQGDDQRAYPWGNQWDDDRCNNNAHHDRIIKTTPVRTYEGKGDSPFGVVDMLGNIWEWCLTEYERGTNDLEGTGPRCRRGGASYVSLYMNVVCHLGLDPSMAGHVDGFRLACS